jgi:uncharacterized membrane protein YkoI
MDMPDLRRARVALVTAALLAAGTARADDHERARHAREAGEILPLARVLVTVERDFTGTPIEVELEREDGRWVYEVELLTPSGDVLELEYDAATGAFLEGEGRGLDAARRKR